MIVRGSGAQFKAEAWRHWWEIKYDKCHGFIANTSTVRDPKKPILMGYFWIYCLYACTPCFIVFDALGPKFTLLLQSADNNYRITHVIFLLVDVVCREINNMGFSKWHVTVSISFRLWSLIVVLTKGHRMPAGWRACAAWDPKLGGCFHCCHVEDYADEWWLTGKAKHWIRFWRPKMLICMPYCLVMLNHLLWLSFFFGNIYFNWIVKIVWECNTIIIKSNSFLLGNFIFVPGLQIFSQLGS